MTGYPENPTTLELFMFDTCPFCRRVIGWISANWKGAPEIVCRDINRDAEARVTLERVGGKTQVPCLFIDGAPLYESADIVAYLESVNA